jgi:hypothetical protein
VVRAIDHPPGKWEVYERFLRIPYYAVYDRYQNNFRAFRLEGTAYQEQDLPKSQIWFEELDLGLGVWEGLYKDISGIWLRWYDAQGEWVPMEIEQGIDQGKQEVARNLLQEGMEIALIAKVSGLSIKEIQQLRAEE